ncbi:MAG TPA: tetratricopeptide repeat protein [Methylomirabilota bacterium]
MRRLLCLVFCVVLAGCATAQRRGEQALYAGQYNEAIHLFQSILAEDPDRLDARLGLGIALYKAGALADAALTLDEVLARAPAEGAALLYRGLAAIQQREDAVAVDHLTRFRDVARIPRFDAQVTQALRILGGAAPPSVDTREFMATSLEETVRSARELQEARRAVERAYLSAFPAHCAPTRRGWICF